MQAVSCYDWNSFIKYHYSICNLYPSGSYATRRLRCVLVRTAWTNPGFLSFETRDYNSMNLINKKNLIIFNKMRLHLYLQYVDHFVFDSHLGRSFNHRQNIVKEANTGRTLLSIFIEWAAGCHILCSLTKKYYEIYQQIMQGSHFVMF